MLSVYNLHIVPQFKLCPIVGNKTQASVIVPKINIYAKYDFCI